MKSTDHVENNDRDSFEPDSKRRKLRKGTRSCWDCKRRKVKCEFTLPTDEICIACRRRGSHCVSQEFPEQVSAPSTIYQEETSQGQLADRLLRVESLLSRLVEKVGQPDPPSESDPGFLTPTPTVESEARSYLANQDCSSAISSPDNNAYNAIAFPLQRQKGQRAATSAEASNKASNKSRELLQILSAAFPSREDIEALKKIDVDSSIYLFEISTRSNIDLSKGGHDIIAWITEPPSRDTHPVLLAKKMLVIALILQLFPPKSPHVFSEEPLVIRERLAEVAIRYVTTNEQLTGPLDTLECILLESQYHANLGNLRRAWLALRRGMMVGQLMGIDRPNPPHLKRLDTTKPSEPAFLWHEIIYYNRFYSLMLGLPCDVITEPLEIKHGGPMGTSWLYLEMKHSETAKFLLERKFGEEDFDFTQKTDAMLIQVAKSVPDDFWSMPNFDQPDEPDHSAFWTTVRSLNQVKHYSMLNCLHLPYLLRENSGRKYEYSKIACLMAAREVVRRYHVFRCYKPILSCCRPLDFVTLVAALSIAVAHLNTHRHQNSYAFLPHQRHSDLALLNQILGTMDRVAALNDDTMTYKSAHLLRRLMHIEEEAFHGHFFTTEVVQPVDIEDFPENATREQANLLHIDIPYFGTIRISRDETESRYGKRSGSKTDTLNTPPSLSSTTQSPFSGDSVEGGARQLEKSQGLPIKSTSLFIDPLNLTGDDMDPLQQFSYPGLAASVDDWAFQGVDTAFFGNLIGSSELSDWGANESIGWTQMNYIPKGNM